MSDYEKKTFTPHHEPRSPGVTPPPPQRETPAERPTPKGGDKR